MRAVDIIRSKRDGHALTPAAIDTFSCAAATGLWPDYQLSALLMAITLRGMDRAETVRLTSAMVQSGATLAPLITAVPGVKVGKHSTGGVGDKTSLIIAPLAAACGCIVPKMSGRGLGHTGGTLDKLESIPGYRTHLSVSDFVAIVRQCGCGIMGPTEAIVPADRKLYHLRDVTATVESIPLITASILSKKLAEGLDVLVLDVKCGDGAFMKTASDARELARSLVEVGTQLGVRVEAVVTDMSTPLGLAVGNALEVAESIATLRGEGPADLTALCIDLTARMVRLAGLEPTAASATTRVEQALRDGSGLERLRRMIEAHGGDGRVVDDPAGVLPRSAHVEVLRADRAGVIGAIHAEAVGTAAMRLGAGRDHAEARIDPAVGVVLRCKPGDTIRPMDVLAELHCQKPGDAEVAMGLLREAIVVAESGPLAIPLILDVIDSATAEARP